ncbi:MAG TPA: arylesterase, partial [Steroidobacteraceae bacterium]
MKRLFALFVLMVAASSAVAEEPVILVFGDSISAGYGLDHVEQGWVELLKTRLKALGYGYQVVNASVSGETTAGGLARLPRALEVHHPKIVILELGGNDGLRALPISQMRANLTQMADQASAAGAKVVLLGMRMPPNYGPDYTEQFRLTFSELANDKKLPVVPFLLNDIALTPNLMQDDQIHPN